MANDELLNPFLFLSAFVRFSLQKEAKIVNLFLEHLDFGHHGFRRIGVEGGDDVLDLIFFWECEVVQVPVGHDELEMALSSDKVLNLLALLESVTHDRNKHVEHMNYEEESSETKHRV